MGGTFGEPTFSARQREIPEGERGIGEEVMDPKEQLVQVTNLLTPLVEGTDTNQLDNETPCSDFRVRDLIGHFTFGRFLITTVLSNKRVEAKIGKAAFLDPDTETLPFNLHGPFTKNLSINYFDFAKVIPVCP